MLAQICILGSHFSHKLLQTVSLIEQTEPFVLKAIDKISLLLISLFIHRGILHLQGFLSFSGLSKLFATFNMLTLQLGELFTKDDIGSFLLELVEAFRDRCDFMIFVGDAGQKLLVLD